METNGFMSLDLLACEGIVSGIDEQVNRLEGDAWDVWVDLSFQLVRDPSIHGSAYHLLYVGQKRVQTRVFILQMLCYSTPNDRATGV